MLRQAFYVRPLFRYIAMFLTLTFLSATATAIEIYREEESAPTPATRIEDDALYLGKTLVFGGIVESLIFFGETLVMSGTGEGNLVAAGKSLQVDGVIGDDTFVAGRRVTLNGELGSTTFAAAESIELTSSGTIDGALLAGGDTVTVAGTVDGDLYVGAGTLIISGTVTGDVTAGAKEIVITDTATVMGDFTYDSEEALTEAERARVNGAIRLEEWGGEQGKAMAKFPGKWAFRLVASLSTLVFALLLYLFPGTRTLDVDRGHRRFWKTIAWGLIPFFGFPILVAFVFFGGIVFGITIPIGIALVAGLGILGYVLYALALPQIGNYLSSLAGLKVHTRSTDAPFLRTVLGFAPVLVLGMIPVLNGIAFILVASLGWGIALEKLFSWQIGSLGGSDSIDLKR